MAKVNKPVPSKPYKSEFGSDSSMIDEEKTKELNDKKNMIVSTQLIETVICKDQFGYYETEKFRINNNMADPNRCAGSRVKLS